MAKPCGCTPVHVTQWDRVKVEGGVLYVPFWSGATEHLLSMGPCMGLELKERIRRALTRADVLPLVCRKEDGTH